jgi:NMD protein affecting ribosome stability and mRNA decay
MKGTSRDNGRQDRRDRLIKERVHDPYMARSKPVEPTVCPECRVVFSGGRWQWQAGPPQHAHEELCPACQRIQDKVPAGILTLSGDFFVEHRSEIMNLVHNQIEEQKALHPMKRHMATEDQDDGSTIITFTDIHLPRGIGQAIESAYEGELNIHYSEEAAIVRVKWQR